MEGRDEKGHWIPGFSGRTINPDKLDKKMATRKEFKEQLLFIVQKKDWYDVVVSAIDKAKEGDWHAREWLSDHLIGKPVQGIDLTSKGQGLVRPDLKNATDEELDVLEQLYRRSAPDLIGDTSGESET